MNETSGTATEFFSSRLGLLLAGIGMAVGTGNIWRFPRIAAKHGGLAFIVLWLLALLLWSIPLMMAEMVLGRETRKGPIGAVRAFAGRKHTWMGCWIAFVTLAIMFYYSVVAGWCLRYFTYFAAGYVPGGAHEAATWWQAFVSTPWQTVSFHLASVLLAGIVVSRGVEQGVERANKILLPALFVMLAGLVVRALTLPGAWNGVRYLFHLDTGAFFEVGTWLEAFSQSAWSTGAGWGLLLTFAVYAGHDTGSPTTDCFIIGLSNNLASILAALVVIPTVFAFSGSQAEAGNMLAAGNTGLTFTSLAGLFGRLASGRIIGTAFFLCLFFAALTSLISMFELGSRVLVDFGVGDRRRATRYVAAACFFFGLPSALSQSFFANQDWVWGLGLLVSGLFIAVTVRLGGLDRCVSALFQPDGYLDRKLWKIVLVVVIPLLFVVLTGWWLYQGSSWEKLAWWNPWARYSPGTVILQWLLVLGLSIAFNDRLNTWMDRAGGTGRTVTHTVTEEDAGA